MSTPPEDPYQILKVPRTATQSQIKSAYRKLALKYHPDRQSSSEEKERCTKVFASIGNAYEILADKDRREEYDRFGTVGGGGSRASHGNMNEFNMGGFGGFSGFSGFDDMFNDPFFSGGRDRRNKGFAFTDPFELFKEAFGDDFGGGHGDNHMDPMSSIMNNMMGGIGNMGGMSSSSFTSSSFSSSGGGTRESISTRTEIVNGKKRTVTERVVQKPDGTVERHVESSDGNGMLEGGDNGFGRGRVKRLEGRGSRRWPGW